jgi:hypothetical protein
MITTKRQCFPFIHNFAGAILLSTPLPNTSKSIHTHKQTNKQTNNKQKNNDKTLVALSIIFIQAGGYTMRGFLHSTKLPAATHARVAPGWYR